MRFLYWLKNLFNKPTLAEMPREQRLMYLALRQGSGR